MTEWKGVLSCNQARTSPTVHTNAEIRIIGLLETVPYIP